MKTIKLVKSIARVVLLLCLSYTMILCVFSCSISLTALAVACGFAAVKLYVRWRRKDPILRAYDRWVSIDED